jgi:hypothetical protein
VIVAKLADRRILQEHDFVSGLQQRVAATAEFGAMANRGRRQECQSKIIISEILLKGNPPSHIRT